MNFNEKFKNIFNFLPAFYLIMWLMISPKIVLKIAILKICQRSDTDRQFKQDLYTMTLMSIEFNGTFLQKEMEYH